MNEQGAPIASGEKQLSPPRCHVAHAWLDAEIFDALQRDAASRGLHVDQFLADLVTMTYRPGGIAERSR